MLGQTLTSATSPMTGSRISTKTWLTMLPPAKDTCCSAAYCLCTHYGQQKCHFSYPTHCSQRQQDGEPELWTAQNDNLVNSFNPVQLSAWYLNMDMHYTIAILSCHKVNEYCAKWTLLPAKERDLHQDSEESEGWRHLPEGCNATFLQSDDVPPSLTSSDWRKVAYAAA